MTRYRLHDVSRILGNRIPSDKHLYSSMNPKRMMTNLQSAALVTNLRQEVAEAKDILNKQVEETAQQKAVEAAESKNLNEMIRTLKDQNDEVYRAQSPRSTSYVDSVSKQAEQLYAP